ncbi:MAG: molybdopterin synthase catalytic subunit [Sphingomonadales bacterium]|jgi:molybdopterin synthase catalytic subunit|nr:molybdopterin synthase catalytic subunit [Sphingomonadales bacterium]
MVRLEPDELRPAEALERFIASLAGDGAVVSFVGLARATDDSGKAVTGLFLDCYPGMTEASLEAIAADAHARFQISAVAIVHRSGAVAPGAPIVFAAAAAPHRRAAFEAADYLMDRLKTDAAFWKREDKAGGAAWVEPRQSDRADRARWSD